MKNVWAWFVQGKYGDIFLWLQNSWRNFLGHTRGSWRTSTIPKRIPQTTETRRAMGPGRRIIIWSNGPLIIIATRLWPCVIPTTAAQPWSPSQISVSWRPWSRASSCRNSCDLTSFQTMNFNGSDIAYFFISILIRAETSIILLSVKRVAKWRRINASHYILILNDGSELGVELIPRPEPSKPTILIKI